MRGLPIRLGIPILALIVLAVASQFAIPPYLEHRVAGRLAEHGGTAHVEMSAFPSLRLLFGHGSKLTIRASGINADLTLGQRDVFSRLDKFAHVDVTVTSSRAGPFTIREFRLHRVATRVYAVAVAAQATAGDVARYAGQYLGGDFGQALAGLATSALGGFDRPVPVEATMLVDTRTRPPQASDVQGDVAGLPAGPLAGVVANTLLAAY